MKQSGIKIDFLPESFSIIYEDFAFFDNLVEIFEYVFKAFLFEKINTPSAPDGEAAAPLTEAGQADPRLFRADGS